MYGIWKGLSNTVARQFPVFCFISALDHLLITMTIAMTMMITLSIQEKAEWLRRRKTKKTKERVFGEGGVAIRSLTGWSRWSRQSR